MSNTITPTVFYRTLNVEGLDIFYREAGPQDAPICRADRSDDWRKIAITLIDHFEGLESREKLGSDLGQLRAENRVKPWSVTQSQAKRINEIASLWFLRDQPPFP